jgi:Fe-S cluster assembly ATP-binding protein
MSTTPLLEIRDLRASIDGKEILKGLSLSINAGEVHAIMGPNGSVAIPGVTMVNFLRQAMNAKRGEDVPIREFREQLFAKMDLLKMDQEFARRYVNDGFSGGEKKRAEMLQLAMLQPAMAVLDETDSGLDIDALRTVAEGVNALMNPEMGLLLITHYQRLLNYIKPGFVHVLIDGRIARSGGAELAEELEVTGYDEMEEALAVTANA